MVGRLIKFFFFLSSLLLGIASSIYIYNESSWYYYKYRPINEVFVAGVHVPDFIQGENPQIRYITDKKENFDATFEVHVVNSQGQIVCRGESFKQYEYVKGVSLPDDTSLNWYIDKDPKTGKLSNCANNLMPGFYTINTYYEIEQLGKPIRQLETNSNIFEVKEK